MLDATQTVAPDATQTQTATPPAPSPSVTFDTLKGLSGEAFTKLFPADIASQGYMKGVDNFDAFVKKFDGAQRAMGQRATPLPTDDASKWQTWHSQVAPKSAAEYAINGATDEVKALLHKAGASSWQANELVNGYNAMIEAAVAAEDKAFTDTLNAALGANKDATLDKAKQILSVALPANMKPLLEKLDGNGMAALSVLATAVADKFGGADNIIKTNAAPVTDKASVMAALREQFAISSDMSKPLAARKTAEDKVKVITEQLRALG